jgi:hypothetical protein
VAVSRNCQTIERLGVLSAIRHRLGRWHHVDRCGESYRTGPIRLDYLQETAIELDRSRHQRIGEIQREVHEEKKAGAAEDHHVTVPRKES